MEVFLQGSFGGVLWLGWEGQRAGCGTRLLAAMMSEGLETLRLWVSSVMVLAWAGSAECQTLFQYDFA